MDIFYSPYSLTPLKRLNRTSTMEKKYGVYLKAKINGHTTYADYFPHASFGDRGWEQFITEFNLQKTEYDKKILFFLLNEHKYHSIPEHTFRNHQLWDGTEDLHGTMVKYKLHKIDDRTFLDPLKRGIKVRLDANGLFNRETLKCFLESIPPELMGLIEYFEDPLVDKNWSDLGILAAQDLINGTPHHAYIHRPNCKFYPATERRVFLAHISAVN